MLVSLEEGIRWTYLQLSSHGSCQEHTTRTRQCFSVTCSERTPQTPHSFLLLLLSFTLGTYTMGFLRVELHVLTCLMPFLWFFNQRESCFIKSKTSCPDKEFCLRLEHIPAHFQTVNLLYRFCLTC